MIVFVPVDLYWTCFTIHFYLHVSSACIREIVIFLLISDIYGNHICWYRDTYVIYCISVWGNWTVVVWWLVAKLLVNEHEKSRWHRSANTTAWGETHRVCCLWQNQHSRWIMCAIKKKKPNCCFARELRLVNMMVACDKVCGPTCLCPALYTANVLPSTLYSFLRIQT